MYTVQIVSDLHIEKIDDINPDPIDFITPSANILILAGDIGSLYKLEQLTNFLRRICYHFELVLYVPGNNEWYMIPNYFPVNWNTLEKRLKKIENDIDNLYVLNRSSVIIGNVCIAGATLWSYPKCKIPPFIVRIKGMYTKDYKKRHIDDLNYIKSIMKYCKNNAYKLIVVTHHPPTEKVLKNTNKRKKYISLYATNLDYLLSKNKVHTWICGHIHKNFDFYTENGCRVLGNQKGKPKDFITDYKKDFIITI